MFVVTRGYLGSLGLVVTSGYGVDTVIVAVPAVSPKIVMRVSFDGGKNYGNARMRSMGRIGEYGTVIAWNGLGTGKDTVIEVYGSDPVKVALTGANFDAEVLES